MNSFLFFFAEGFEGDKPSPRKKEEVIRMEKKIDELVEKLYNEIDDFDEHPEEERPAINDRIQNLLYEIYNHDEFYTLVREPQKKTLAEIERRIHSVNLADGMDLRIPWTPVRR